MERRLAPESYDRQTMAAFTRAGAIGFGFGAGGAFVIYFAWPGAPIWIFSALFGLAFVIVLVLFFRMRPKFKCPECGKELGRQDRLGKEEGERIRFVCRTCQIEWETGMCVPGGG